MNEYATYTCDGCGRSGNADDGITGYGEPCPDPDCRGVTIPDDPKQDEYTYRKLLADLRFLLERGASNAETPPVELSADHMHVALDAISWLELSLPDDKNPAGTSGVVTPWEDYT